MLGQRLLTPLVIFAASLSATSLHAESEDALYGAALPADAVFIRQLGAAEFPILALGHRLTEGDFEETAYTAISAKQLQDAKPGSFYTILSDGNETRLIEEPSRDDRSRVHLFLLNADETEARLVVADGGPEVIASVPTGQIETRSVNPLAVALSVETDIGETRFDVVLRRGVNVTFLVQDGEVSLIEHRFGPVIGHD